jgi:hypothetical protein
MQPARALAEFERFLAERGQRVASLAVVDGIAAMLAFYGDVPADGCDPASDGDMLLYQWGTYDVGRGRHFTLDITRQFIVGSGEDDDIWQLSLTFWFAPSPALTALSAGDRWCHSRDERNELLAFIRSSPAYAAACAALPLHVELVYECAG